MSENDIVPVRRPGGLLSGRSVMRILYTSLLLIALAVGTRTAFVEYKEYQLLRDYPDIPKYRAMVAEDVQTQKTPKYARATP